MFELKVCGLVEAKLFANNNWPTHIISLIDPGTTVSFTCEHHLIRHFNDIESQIECKNVFDWILPKIEDLEAVLEFTKDLRESDKLIVHCHQGVSRSTAMAIGIMSQYGMNAREAYTYVENIRDCLLPNGLISKFVDDMFNFNGELVDIVKENRKYLMNRYLNTTESDNKKAILEMKSILDKLKNIT